MDEAYTLMFLYVPLAYEPFKRFMDTVLPTGANAIVLLFTDVLGRL